MKKKLLGILLITILLATFALPFGVSAASGIAEKIRINGVDVQGSYTATGIRYEQTEVDSFYDSATLTLSDGASISSIDVGNVILKIVVNGNVTINGSIYYDNFGQTSSPQPLTITGSGSLTVNGCIGFSNASVTISGGLTLSVTNPNGAAIGAKGFTVTGGSKVTATGSTDGVVSLGTAYVSDGSALTATGNNGYGMYVYKYESNQWQGADLRVTGGSTLTVKSTEKTALYQKYTTYLGTLTLDDSSTIKLSSDSGKLFEGNTNLPASFQWTADGATKQSPYESCNINSYSSLELKGNSVFVPQLTPSSTTTLYLQDTNSQTFTVSPATAVAAPSTVSYQWHLNGTAIPGATDASYTFSDTSAEGTYTIACDVKLNSSSGAMRLQTTVKVVRRDISDSVSLSGFSAKWNNYYTPVVTYDGKTLTLGTDYTATMSCPITIMGNTSTITYDLSTTELARYPIGSHTTTITFLGKYTGTKSTTFTVSPVPLSEVTVELEDDTLDFTGNSLSAKVKSITYNGYTLTQGSAFGVNTSLYDYSIGISFACAPGNYTLTLDANGTDSYKTSYFTGTKNISYKVVKVTPKLESLNISQTFTYGDAYEAPATIVWDASSSVGAVTMTLGTDYTLVSPTGKVGNVGANTATIRFTDSQAYFTGTLEFPYTVTAKALSDADVTLSRDSFECNGSVQTPTVSVAVKLGDDTSPTTLVEGIDYTLTVDNAVNVGTYSVTVEGKGNYSGTIVKSFSITQGTPTANLFTMTPPALLAYDKTAKVATVTADGIGAITVGYYSDAQLQNKVDPVNAGTYYVAVTAEASTNYKAITTPLSIGSFTVTKREIASADFADIPNEVYDGAPHTPEVHATDLGASLILDTDYTVSYENTANAGTKTITVTGTGNYTGSTTITFTVDKATPSYTLPTNLTAVYGQTLADVLIPQFATGSFSWKDSSLSVGNAGSQTFLMDYTPTDTENYLVVNDIPVTVTVEKAEQTITTDTTDRSALCSETLDGRTATAMGAISFESSDPAVASVDPVTGKITAHKAGTVTITVKAAETDNHKPASVAYSVTVEHSHSTDWSSGGATHWHECACGHRADETAHTSGSPATCTKDQICPICRHVLNKAKGHKIDFKVSEHAHEGKCVRCDFEITLATHTWDSGKVTLAPTKDAVGEKTFNCIVCKGIRTEEIAKLPSETTAAPQPPVTEPVETDPIVTDPVETDPIVTEPVETEPVETESVETEPVETEPIETDPAEPETTEMDPSIPEKHGCKSVIGVLIALVALAIIIPTAVLLMKKRAA